MVTMATTRKTLYYCWRRCYNKGTKPFARSRRRRRRFPQFHRAHTLRNNGQLDGIDRVRPLSTASPSARVEAASASAVGARRPEPVCRRFYIHCITHAELSLFFFSDGVILLLNFRSPITFGCTAASLSLSQTTHRLQSISSSSSQLCIYTCICIYIN